MSRAGLAAALALCVGLAGAARAAPVVSPDRIADVAVEGEDPFYAYDDFAWRAFVALNWPAEADRAEGLAAPGPRLWERFAPRESALGLTAALPCAVPAGDKTVLGPAPYAEFNQASFTPGQADSPLVARNRAYVRYETRVSGFDPPRPAPEGAVAVKAAWMPLTPRDPPAMRARYYVTQGWIADVAASRAAGRIVCAKVDLALVGLHLVIRTKSQPQGIWASFEHIDNVPPVGDGDAREPDAHEQGFGYAFNDPGRPQNAIFPPQGWRQAAPVSADNPPRESPEPSQVIRQRPIRREIMQANHTYWAALGDSVWRRYMLVSVQWPTVIAPRNANNDSRYFPGLRPEPGSKAAKYKVAETDDANLANSVMETYNQAAPASCMACHHAVGNARGYDFLGIASALPSRD